MEPMFLAAQTLLLGLALALLLVYTRKVSELEERVTRVEEREAKLAERVDEVYSLLRGVSSEHRSLKRALAAALASLEAETALERVRRKRRRRYIVFHLVSEDGYPPPEDVEKAILQAVEKLAGQLTVALGRVQLVYYHPDIGAGIIAASHDTKYVVLAALGLVRRINGKRVVVVPVRTTGTIKRAKRALGLTIREMQR